VKRGVDKNPSDPKIPLDIGKVYMRLGRSELAAYWFHIALTRDPRQKTAHRHLAEYYASTGQYKQAQWHRQQAQ
jgi:Tfp pilus assembly protein PilF